MRMFMIVGCVLFVTNPLRALQPSINWLDDSEAGVAASQKSSLPILFLVLAPADAPAAAEEKAARSFQDPAVQFGFRGQGLVGGWTEQAPTAGPNGSQAALEVASRASLE